MVGTGRVLFYPTAIALFTLGSSLKNFLKNFPKPLAIATPMCYYNGGDKKRTESEVTTMKTIVLVVKMLINDVEWNDSYEYEGMFLSEDELQIFIRQNEEVGNTVDVFESLLVMEDLETLKKKYPSHF